MAVQIFSSSTTTLDHQLQQPDAIRMIRMAQHWLVITFVIWQLHQLLTVTCVCWLLLIGSKIGLQEKLTEKEEEDHARDERLPKLVLCVDCVHYLLIYVVYILHCNRLYHHHLLATGCIPWMTPLLNGVLA